MIVELVSRLFGMIVLGVVGWQLGVYLAGSAPPEYYLRYVVAGTVIGVILGGLFTPWLTIKPIRHLRRRIRQLPAQELVAIIIGLIVGLLIAALLSPILANLSSPLGEILPFVAAVLFGYLGVVVTTLRRRDLFALLGGRFSGSSTEP
ncbi:hypothetical protein ACFLUM_02735 [Chloroflexota bacterium]